MFGGSVETECILLTMSHAAPATLILSSPPSLNLVNSSAISRSSWKRSQGVASDLERTSVSDSRREVR